MTAEKRGMILMICFAVLMGTAVAQSSVAVTATGNPGVDVPAVQAAVDQGCSIIVTGPFDRPPATPAGAIYDRMVTLSKSVAIWGSSPDESGDLPTIREETGRSSSTLRASRSPFSDCTSFAQHRARFGCLQPAAWLSSTAGCRHNRIRRIYDAIGAAPHPPSATHLGHPGNFSRPRQSSTMTSIWPRWLVLGPCVLSCSTSEDPGQGRVSERFGNKIRNVTEPAINFRVIGGRVYVERNVLIG